MKAVILSVRPQWCREIVSGRKTLEIRRNRPKLETPFKVYIYQTRTGAKQGASCSGVIGEFICDNIRRFDVPYPAYQNKLDPDILKKSCLTYYALHRYAYHDDLYGWNISDLVVYSKPEKLGKFGCLCKEYFDDTGMCGDCGYYVSHAEGYPDCACEGLKPIKRPPQSWCYVEELEVAKR